MTPEEDGQIPKFKTYADGRQFPPVDPRDIKRMREFKRPRDWSGVPSWKYLQDMQAVLSPGADITAITQRCHIISSLPRKLIGPWQHGEELHDAVFRLAATFPIHASTYRAYKIPGDELYPFDPNAFVQALIEETGISHTWEPIQSKIPPGGFSFTWTIASHEGQKPDPEREARHSARALLWDLWRRFSGTEKLPDDIAGLLFADFLIANLDLVREVETGFRTSHFPPPEVLRTLEQNAQRLW